MNKRAGIGESAVILILVAVIIALVVLLLISTKGDISQVIKSAVEIFKGVSK